jgi:hypothetical protein
VGASYDPTLAGSKDRIRRMIQDKRSPWRFQDEEIVATLAQFGTNEAAEIRCAIELLEEEQSGAVVSESRRQGSWSHTKTVTSPGAKLIDTLRQRLAMLGRDRDISPIGAADTEMPEPTALPVVEF